MRHFAVIPFLFLVACGTAPKRFIAPSTAAVHQNITEARTQISSAKNRAGNAKATIKEVREIVKDNPDLVLRLTKAENELDSLTQDLLRADTAAATAEAKLKEADGQIAKLAANANSVAAERDKYKAFYDSGHKYFGLGAIGLGVGILAKHLLILTGVLILCGLLIFGLSLIFPFLGPIVAVGTGFISGIFRKIFRKNTS